MARRLILDTGVLVATERGRAALSEVIHADDDLVIAAVTVAELRTGIELADEARRTSRTEFLVKVLETMPIETMTSPSPKRTAACSHMSTAAAPNARRTT